MITAGHWLGRARRNSSPVRSIATSLDGADRWSS